MKTLSSYITIAPIEKTFFSICENRQVAVLVDKNTLTQCYPRIEKLLPPHKLICIEAGEQYKNLNTCEYIWQQLTDFQFDRKAILINLGGGVIGDMGGFCAATYKRGIDFIQIPTTLLAQVDASVGGKLGIDFQGYKNHIGVFALPQKVLIDVNFLQTLSMRELKSGFAEVLKHCLIADKTAWDNIYNLNLQTFDYHSFDWATIVKHSVAIKEHITATDPTEKGIRKTLNFGHTIGHAIESFYLNTPKPLLHGEAIALGMIAESYLSWQRNLLPENEFLAIKNFLLQLYGTIHIAENDFIAIAQHTQQDKKNENNQILACLLNGIGNCLYNEVITQQEVIRALEFCQTSPPQ
jgi:3-dehydroquinate synthase